jgi:dihydrofolate reductase
MSRNRVIGSGGALPWRMPADMQRFKKRTMGRAVIMGRRTWASMNGPLAGRSNIVLTRDAGFAADGAIVVRTLDDALNAALKARPDSGEVLIVGGADIYRLALPRANRIDLTLVDAVISDGDAFFPEFETDGTWRLVSEERHPADARNPHAFTFQEYERVSAGSVAR